MGKTIIIVCLLILIINCRKKEWEQPDTSGKKCWDCEITITYPDTTIITKDVNCNKTEAEIRENETQQSINLSKVKCKLQ